MSTFGERLNQWLIEQGREPWPQYLLDALDAAAVEAEAKLGEREKETVAFVREAMATWQEGMCLSQEGACQDQQERPS